MLRTDAEAPPNRSRYNAAVTQEVLCFIERYPDRTRELVRRIQEGRLFVSPYLCNTLWGLQSFEAAVRSLYPARRLEYDCAVRSEAAHHIELPSLPWGVATILAGCGIRRLSVPYYAYDSTFARLRTPPLFELEGPDGSQVTVAMDRWACAKAHYTQGAAVLRKPDSVEAEWLPHYRQLGEAYPLRSILASGTHGDISPTSGAGARGFAEAILRYNSRDDRSALLVNATLPMFWRAVEDAEAERPFLTTVRGSFGHSWEAWPVSLAKYAAALREGERRFLTAESLLAIASGRDPGLVERTLARRERAEWCWAMLSDHAWNGTSEANKRHNAELRRDWARELLAISGELVEEARGSLGLEEAAGAWTLFNGTSFARSNVVRLESPGNGALSGDLTLASQVVEEDGARVLYVESPELSAYGFEPLRVKEQGEPGRQVDPMVATRERLEGPFYRVVPDTETGGIRSLLHKPTGLEVVASGGGRTLLQSVYHNGEEHSLGDIRIEPIARGGVLARLAIHGTSRGLRVETRITVYHAVDRVDFDVRVEKQPSSARERLCHAFPLLEDGAEVRAVTSGAVVRLAEQPEGDLVPGADTRRFACSDLFAMSTETATTVVVPLDAFLLRQDLRVPMVEALGSDQNYREVLHDQNGETSFRFRYALQARGGPYDSAAAARFARTVTSPLLVLAGELPRDGEMLPSVQVAPSRAIATCLKPASGPDAVGVILRLWEVAGSSEPVSVDVPGWRRAFHTDLLERNLRPLDLGATPQGATLTVELPARGYRALRLVAP